MRSVYTHITTSLLLQSVMQSITACNTSVGLSMTTMTLRATTAAMAISARLSQHCIFPSIQFSCMTMHEYSKRLFPYFQKPRHDNRLISTHSLHTNFLSPIFSNYPRHTDNGNYTKKRILSQQTTNPPNRILAGIRFIYPCSTTLSPRHPFPTPDISTQPPSHLARLVTTMKSKKATETSNIHAHSQELCRYEESIDPEPGKWDEQAKLP